MAPGTACGDGEICNEQGACLAACFIGAQWVPENAESPYNRCEACQPETNTQDWSAKPDTTSCDDVNYCNGAAWCLSGQCTESTFPCGTTVCNEDVNACQISCDDNDGSACSCGPGQRLCGRSCIAATACCLNSDCIGGKGCEEGVCRCGEAQRDCNNVCIPWTNCCVASDCPSAGQICGTGVCACPTGTRLCADRCIANDVCCTPDDAYGVTSCQPEGASAFCGSGIPYMCDQTCLSPERCCTDSQCGADGCGGAGGAACACPAGKYSCNGACIPLGTCCVDVATTCPTSAVCQASGLPCQCSGGQIQATATTMDTQLVQGAGASITYGAATTINVGVARGAMQFLLGSTAATNIRGNRVGSMTLTMNRAPSDGACGGTCPAAAGFISVFPMNTDWTEGAGGAYEGANWVQRNGPTQTWGLDGASQPGVDVGPLAGRAYFDGTASTLTITLDAQAFAQTRLDATSWMSPDGTMAVLLVPDATALFIMYSSETNAPPNVNLTTCGSN